MRTNIVLDEKLINEAISLTGKKTKKDVVNLALHYLVQSLKSQSLNRQDFAAKYIDHPLELSEFKPLDRDEIYDR